MTTNQVSKTRAKGSGTTLTYVAGGMWSDFLVAMFGTMEVSQSDVGLSLMTYDQTAVKMTVTYDGGPQHPGAFAVADNLLTAVGN